MNYRMAADKAATRTVHYLDEIKKRFVGIHACLS